MAKLRFAKSWAPWPSGPDAGSHGETFLALMQKRLKPAGLYFLDEPETPLSPQRQLALLAILKRAVAEDCQCVIATHSPILMALPGAAIWLFEGGRIRDATQERCLGQIAQGRDLTEARRLPSVWDETEHVALTRAFLASPRRFLDKL